jgi:hypothetical protein
VGVRATNRRRYTRAGKFGSGLQATAKERASFRRTYHAAVAKLADPATSVRPTAARASSRCSAPAARSRPTSSRRAWPQRGRAVHPATVDGAPGELAAAGLAATVGDRQAGRWKATLPPRDPLLEAFDLHGAHYRHTPPEMAARVAAAVQERLTVVLQVAERTLENHPNPAALRVF